MPVIDYRLVNHRGENRILVIFEKNISWNKRIKAVAGARWSKTLCGWTIPDTPENRQRCGLPLQAAPPSVSLIPAVQQYQPSQQPKNLSSNNAAQLQLFIQ